MKRLGNLGRGLVLAAVALMGSASTASAAPMLFELEGEQYADLSASVLFSYTGLSAITGRVDISITNTSTSWDPRLTSFAFNLPSNAFLVTGFSSSLNGWQGSYSRNGI